MGAATPSNDTTGAGEWVEVTDADVCGAIDLKYALDDLGSTSWSMRVAEPHKHPVAIAFARHRLATQPAQSADEAFQAKVQSWLLACFGELIAGDREERNHRFLEEALELVQACGCTASEAHQLVDYVYGRPVGELHQEIGGVMVTLAALCLANDADMDAAGWLELERIWGKVEQIRAKQAAKPKYSPLLQEVVAPSADALREAIRNEVINSPETADFIAGVPLEAAHQRERWPSEHDAGKTPFDWFWLVGYLAQKAASAQVAGNTDKALHHTISTAAALANWHAAISGASTTMRPGIDPASLIAAPDQAGAF